ncbi:DUF6802 family protein [Corynebacterium anserum]|uniref:Uncharacterized protein n=1 Tax=Corynebacterium anserum TaxID=2684406 RepID=A0A7G7YLP2_9CORY|nr:DUF6802 family protein [Corynebacterium anserum]MBC2681428.1 hypothetical protein [Corynebacterium anserum]QNH95412.1 hypothetical protein GP473_00690 [Corynebacterium anserum]
MDFSFSDVTPHMSDIPPISGVEPEDTLLMGVDGVDYEIPIFRDEESATFTDDEGMSILADTDGDGRVDFVSNVTFNGHFSAWRWQSPQENGLPQPHDAPECGAESWKAERWVCVERGEWG